MKKKKLKFEGKGRNKEINLCLSFSGCDCRHHPDNLYFFKCYFDIYAGWIIEEIPCVGHGPSHTYRYILVPECREFVLFYTCTGVV